MDSVRRGAVYVTLTVGSDLELSEVKNHNLLIAHCTESF